MTDRENRAVEPVRLSAHARENVSVLFVAKHALGDGQLHPDDGNHAIYHREVRDILEGLGIRLKVAASYEALFEHPDVDFVFALLNRGGFLNSEMLLPLLCTRLGLPFLGASPILRGLSDDKHLAKLVAASRGVPTAPWTVHRRGAPVLLDAVPPAPRWVIKPNASSASWGVTDAFDLAGVRAAIEAQHEDGHDAIVEPFLDGSDIEVPVITIDGTPVILPSLVFQQTDPKHLRSYWEKRDLVERRSRYRLVPLEDAAVRARVEDMTRRLWEDYRPFDYGRFEFRWDAATGDIRFLELNLNCNLWSQKVFGRAAALAGLSHAELIETILAESLRRHGLLDAPAARSQERAAE